ncbi:MAG: 4-hydroxy-tetrahydrodipicolinate synthase [Salibacteraceae bacterium]|nr:4-hydroxy-tetrahydrodipicolinate synthase [Salibacteraceae bacterium]
MSTSKDFRGTGVAMVTPFKKDSSVDFVALEKLTDHLVVGGVDYLVVQGTTGESATLNDSEKQEVLDCVVAKNAGRLPIVFGHGGNNTQALLDGFKTMNLNGVDAILSASPYYNKPTQAGIVAHFTALADASPLPIILYNVPGRTSSNMSAETTIKLAGHKNVIAVKEASGNLDQVGQVIKHKPGKFLVLSGDDPLIVPHMALGGDGIISVIANAFPAEFSAISKLCFQGDYNKARVIHYALVDFIYMLFEEGNPGGIKASLSILGVMDDHLRLPLVPVSSALKAKLEKAIVEIKSANLV